MMSAFSDTTRSMDTHSSLETIQSGQGVLDPLSMRARRIGRVPTIEKFYRGVTSSIRLLPDFLIIGTQRGGTTALYHYLKTLPCVTPATITDTHFFDKKYSKGLAWYRGHFPTSFRKISAQHLQRRAFVTGEASSSYLFHPHAPKRVAQVLPHVKLITLLRNPVDRAYSQYHHAVDLGYEHLSFEEAIQWEEERLGNEREKVLKNEHYKSWAYMELSYL